jgi:hypothetical protein
MLNDTKARHEVLIKAYEHLKAEHIKLKASTASEQQHQQYVHTLDPAKSGPRPPGLGGYVDPRMLASHLGGDLDAYLYPEVGRFPV